MHFYGIIVIKLKYLLLKFNTNYRIQYMNSTIKNGIKLYVGIVACVMITTTYTMEKKFEDNYIIVVAQKKNLYSENLKGILERSRFLLDGIDKKECEQNNTMQINYSLLPFELNHAIAQHVIPQQINTTEELLKVLHDLTSLSEINYDHKAIVENEEIKRTLLYALSPHYLILEDLKKRHDANKIKKEIFKVSKFFARYTPFIENKGTHF